LSDVAVAAAFASAVSSAVAIAAVFLLPVDSADWIPLVAIQFALGLGFLAMPLAIAAGLLGERGAYASLVLGLVAFVVASLFLMSGGAWN
jgi:hypothetical protein